MKNSKLTQEVLQIMKEIAEPSRLVFRHVESPELLTQVYRLRYQVYCKECNFLRPEEYPGGLESDRYDPYSLHFSASDRHGPIGTVRLVLDNPYGFPFEQYCRGSLDIDLDAIPRGTSAEVSRCVISRHLRRRIGNGVDGDPDIADGADSGGITQRMRAIAFGMYHELYRGGKERGVTHCFALMEKSLYILLARYGFPFNPIGKEIDAYGIVAPYLMKVEDLEQSLYRRYCRCA